MTTREKLDYRDRTEQDEKLDYRDENTEGREEHRTEHPNSSYQAANQHMVKFNDELKAINEKTAMDFEFRKNPAEYDLAERKEALEAVEQAFNKTQWNSNWERRIAAEDIAQNSFQPMYRRIEMAEAAAQHKLPDEFLAAAKEEEIEYAEEHQTEDGAMVLEIGVKDIETAQRLVEQSNGAFQIVSTWQLDHYRDQFADALYDSDKNPNAAEQMGKFLEQGINYYNGEIPREAHLDGKTEEGNTFQQDDEIASGKQQMTKEEVEYDEPSYAEMLTFRRLENLDEETLDHEVSELVHQKLQHTETYLEELQKAGEERYCANCQEVRSVRDGRERPSLGNGRSGPAGVGSSIPGGGGSSPPSAGMATEPGRGRSREKGEPWVTLPFQQPFPCRTPEELQFHTARYDSQASMSRRLRSNRSDRA